MSETDNKWTALRAELTCPVLRWQLKSGHKSCICSRPRFLKLETRAESNRPALTRFRPPRATHWNCGAHRQLICQYLCHTLLLIINSLYLDTISLFYLVLFLFLQTVFVSFCSLSCLYLLTVLSLSAHYLLSFFSLSCLFLLAFFSLSSHCLISFCSLSCLYLLTVLALSAHSISSIFSRSSLFVLTVVSPSLYFKFLST
jgi:hypothetical protein